MRRLSFAYAVLSASVGCTPNYDALGQQHELNRDGGTLDAEQLPATSEEAGSDATAMTLPAADSGSTDAASELDGGDAHVDAGLPPGPCDLSGRWLVVTRVVSAALGGNQNIFRWMYYELAGTGESFAVSKGLACGDGLTGAGFGTTVAVSFEPSRMGTMMKTDYTGRALTSVPSPTGCDVTMEKWYTIQGASVPYYLDPATVLPKASEPASATKPGWEDWDEDGEPGITGDIKGSILGINVTGKVFCAARQWTAMADSVPDVSKSFVGHVTWGVEQNVMKAEGAGLLNSAQATPVADPNLHIVEFVRLSPEQATGDDAAICAAIRALAPTLATTAAPPP